MIAPSPISRMTVVSVPRRGDVDDVGTLDAHTVTVDWGDGTPTELPTLAAGGTFGLSHVYEVPGRYEVTITADDGDGGIARGTRAVVIADLAPAIAPANLGSVTEGVLFTHTGRFSDSSGPEDSWSATVQYETGVVLPLPLNADKSFTLQHVFAQDSPRTVTVTVADRFGRSDTETFAIEVVNAPPAVQAGPDVSILPGTTFSRLVGFSDPGADTWTAQVTPAPVVDATGAGDQYAAGVLYGITHGLSLQESAQLGNLAAREVISHIGPRPAVNLRELAKAAGLRV